MTMYMPKDNDVVLIRQKRGEVIELVSLCDGSCTDTPEYTEGGGWTMSDFPNFQATIPFDPVEDAERVIGIVQWFDKEQS